MQHKFSQAPHQSQFREGGDAFSSVSLSTRELDTAVPETQQSALNFGTDVQPEGEHR